MIYGSNDIEDSDADFGLNFCLSQTTLWIKRSGSLGIEVVETISPICQVRLSGAIGLWQNIVFSNIHILYSRIGTHGNVFGDFVFSQHFRFHYVYT